MQKPVPHAREPILDYHEIMHYLEAKYKFQSRDYANSHPHFSKWAKAKGYNGKDPEGKALNSSQIWYAEYMADPKGNAECPPYLDFWHWLIDQFFDFHNGCEQTLFVAQWLQDETNPAFVNTILGYMQAEYGDEFQCEFSW